MSWDPNTWGRPLRLLLGIATIWPIIYVFLFITVIFSGVFMGAMFAERHPEKAQRIDLIQLEKKIQNGEIKELRITSEEMHAFDRDGRAFEIDVTNESTSEEIIRQARATGPDGTPRVAKIDQNTSQPKVNPFLPVGVFALFAFHILTMCLMFLLMPLYIILPLKNDRLDQNMRIVWVILACTVGMLSDVAYWYLYIWRRPPLSPSTPGSSL